jgi:peptidoglycan/LPS O-acetylase OafA/YrhL
VIQGSHFPSLDGFRGIAIIMVVFFHLHLSWNDFYVRIFNGALGVQIFFVLSGFLITTLCIKEKVVTQNISLRNFYLRRSLRIFPVAYLFIFVLIILNLVFKFNINYMSILGAALYLMNLAYFGKYSSESKTGHFWSLAVEEQFYLVFPFILKKNFRAYLTALLAIIFLLPLLICLQHFYNGLNNDVITKLTHYLIKFQGITVGCLFSVLVFKYPFIVNNKMKVAANILAIVLILWIHCEGYFSLKMAFSNLLISFLVGHIIITNLAPANDFIFKALNTKFIKTVGVLSYSIYIWQQLFTYHDDRFPFFINKFPFNIVSLVIVSWLSYYFYERYFLRLKSKLSKPIKNKEVITCY